MTVRVDSLTPFPIRIRAKESLRGGTFSYTHYQTVLVKASVDGVEGWGEAMTRSDPDASAILVRYLGTKVADQEFSSVKEALDAPWRELRVRGHTRGVDVEALSGIEIALQDAVGKIRGVPLCRMLSDRPAKDVPVFAGSLFASRGPLEDQVEFVKANELGGAKVKVGFGVEKDAGILQKVRGLWPEGMIVADANGAYDAEGARKACSRFSSFDLAWFEEPVLSDDLEAYARLKGSEVRIGAGESWFAGDFQGPIDAGLIGVIEPSVSRCGGVLVEAEVARKAKGRGIEFSPMTGMNSIISLAASIQIASAVGSVGAEYNPFPNPIQADLGSGLERPRRGRVRVPDRPGLGIDIDQRFVRANAAT